MTETRLLPLIIFACGLASCAGGVTTQPLSSGTQTKTVTMALQSGQSLTIPLVGVGSLSGTVGTVPANDALQVVETKMPADANGNYSFVSALTPTADTPAQALGALQFDGAIPGIVCGSAINWPGTLAAGVAGLGRFCFDNNGPRDDVTAQLVSTLMPSTLQAGQSYTVQLDVTMNETTTQAIKR